MPTENKVDCPALHKRSSSYPFGDRVPRTVRMLKTVTADPMPGIGLAYIKGDAPVAKAGQIYPVWTNSHGAVTAAMEDGTRLGLRPAEFEVESWHHLAAEPAPQPHPEPISWLVGTAIWWTKAEAERDAAQTGLPIVPVGPLISIPDGYCLMPKRLTAENGAKALLLGEFKLEVTQACPECRKLDEPVEGCEICDGEGEYGQRHTIPWELIKYIYSEAVRGLALQPRRSVAKP
ncbi:hypothetical protein [Pseudomonas sp. SWI44]|uniref:hypothetical protein n=1 Tax=Pseudomonas sp. SWI44 TaxID=2083053 RepID=UPI002113A842|nr:hypothetical protein [Pseudomonas sp. SWI44]